MSTTKEILDHHLASFGKGDLDGILFDYAPDAVLFAPQGTLKGKDAMKPLFVSMFAEFAKPGASFALKHESIVGDYAYIIWNAESADNVYEGMSDLFVLRDGRIIAHAFGGKITAKT